MMLRIYRQSDGTKYPVEECFYIETERAITPVEFEKLQWFLSPPGYTIHMGPSLQDHQVVEIGPQVNIETPDSANIVSSFRAAGLPISRIEMSKRFAIAGDTPEGIIARELDKMTQDVYKKPLENFDSTFVPEAVYSIPALEQGLEALIVSNKKYGLGINIKFLEHYLKMVRRMGRDLTNVEFVQLGNNNSDHSRHLSFNAPIKIDGVLMPHTLFEVVKRPWKENPGISIVAFRDNAGAIEGPCVLDLLPRMPGQPSTYELIDLLFVIIATAESHNHPTHISPFEGATTGPGGRIRDRDAFGRGTTRAYGGTVGYFVGNLHLKGYLIPGEVIGGIVSPRVASARDILIKGSNGASDYHNKYGEPLVGGFCRAFGQMIDDTWYEARKAVLYTGGIGFADSRHTFKDEAKPGMLIIRIGGPAYPIGFGGGAASSGADNTIEADRKSVQRGDPEMGNRTSRVIRACVDLGERNPIKLIHDQGAGGPSNLLTELVEKVGGRIDSRLIIRGDKSMSTLYVWVCEFQEGYGIVIDPVDLPIFQMICHRERVNCEILGEITGDGRIVVYDSDISTPVNLSLADINDELPKIEFDWKRVERKFYPPMIPKNLSLKETCRITVAQLSSGSKGFLHHKADRSVTGLVAMQPTVGPTQVGVADAGVIAASHFGVAGVATAIGEQPIVGLINAGAGARMGLAESFTNGQCVLHSGRKNCTFRINWMVALKIPGEGPRLLDSANAMADFMIEMGVHLNGGKDSTSMSADINGTTAVTPLQMVAKMFVPVADITKQFTPDLKKGRSNIGYLDLGRGKMRLGGSAFLQALNQLGDDCPDIDAASLKQGLDAIEVLMREGIIKAYHDISDGGLFTTIAEMCLAGNRGAEIYLPPVDPIRYLLSQEIGMVFEYNDKDDKRVREVFREFDEHFRCVGRTSRKYSDIHQRALRIETTSEVLEISIPELRHMWEATSLRLEEEQTPKELVDEERQSHTEDCEVRYRVSFEPIETPAILKRRPKVAVIRDEGTNGDSEMRSAFHYAGCDPTDIVTSDFLDGRVTSLREYQNAIYCGGFSRADALGSARGWAGIIKFNPRLEEIFNEFYAREDTLSLAVCNGAQLMQQLEWMPERGVDGAPYLGHNRSRKFESRLVAVRVEEDSPSVWLKDMGGWVLPIWADHGEGQYVFRNEQVKKDILRRKLAPLRYVAPDGKPTERYPFNPNGSREAIAGLCSPCGRHISMMPHPERSFLLWQTGTPESFRKFKSAPLLRMFQNARTWCLEH